MLISFVGIVLLGLFLGMRHSTDPDHVVAVSTIVSRRTLGPPRRLHRRAVGRGAHADDLLGWLGNHSFRAGHSPAHRPLDGAFRGCDADPVGVLNLSGAVRWLTEKFTPALGAGGKPAISTDVTDGSDNRFKSRRKNVYSIWLVPTVAPAADWARSRTGWIGRGCAARALDDSQSPLGDRLLGSVRRWNRRRHDDDDLRHGNPDRVRGQSLHARQPLPRSRIRNRQHRLWNVPDLSDRIR